MLIKFFHVSKITKEMMETITQKDQVKITPQTSSNLMEKDKIYNFILPLFKKYSFQLNCTSILSLFTIKNLKHETWF